MVRTSVLFAAFLCSIQAVLGARSAGCKDGDQSGKPVEWEPVPGQVKLFRVNDRNVRVTVPPNYKKGKTSPMIVAYHDRDQSPEYLEYESAFGDPDVNKDAIMVYPSADNERWTSDFQRAPHTGTKSANYTEDLAFTAMLVRDLESLICMDTAKVYAAGLGVGGGMMHLLACDPEISKIFAAFAAVGGAFGKGKRGTRPWGQCDTTRTDTPVMEVHGMDDRIFGYYLTEGENGKARQIPSHWIEDWADRDQCGEAEDDPVVSKNDPATLITRLENGIMTETIEYGGSVIRVARRCFSDPAEAEFPLPVKALTEKQATILHYQVKGYGHGWPRQQLRKEEESMFKDRAIKVESKTQFFDTSKIMLKFFEGHTLPMEFAARAEIIETNDPELENQNKKLPSPKELEKRLKQMQVEQKKKGGKAMTDEQIEEQVAKFAAMQSQAGQHVEEEKSNDKDEL